MGSTSAAAADGPDSLDSLQAKLGHFFSDINLLEVALTHPSLEGDNNQRMEFLGDSVLGFTVAELLYEAHPDKSEGELTQQKALIVRNAQLAQFGEQLELGRYLKAMSGVITANDAARRSILADTFEALIGAMWLDGAADAITELLDLLIEAARLDEVDVAVALDSEQRHPKSRLQELLHIHNHRPPRYDVVEEPVMTAQGFWTVSCQVDGFETTHGTGTTKKHAESVAAVALIKQLEP